jgi:hypothetical protein
LDLFLEEKVVVEGLLVETVHVEAVQRGNEFVDDSHLVLAMRFVDARLAEQSI